VKFSRILWHVIHLVLFQVIRNFLQSNDFFM
jgi:hypothetical protein